MALTSVRWAGQPSSDWLGPVHNWSELLLVKSSPLFGFVDSFHNDADVGALAKMWGALVWTMRYFLLQQETLGPRGPWTLHRSFSTAFTCTSTRVTMSHAQCQSPRGVELHSATLPGYSQPEKQPAACSLTRPSARLLLAWARLALPP